MPSKFGRALVGFYYKNSPFAADLIAKHKLLRAATRLNLIPLVAFSSCMLHFGPIITAFMLFFIFTIPIFSVRFCKRRANIFHAKIRKAN